MTQNNDEKNVLENPDIATIKEHEIAPLRLRVDKCYSKENYEEFQGAVEKIVLKTMSGKDGVQEIKTHATDATKTYFSDEMWKQKTFWFPTLIAFLGVAIASIALF